MRTASAVFADHEVGAATGANRVLKRFAVAARPRNVAFSPDTSRASLAAENGDTVSVVHVSSHRVIRTIWLTGAARAARLPF
jgi:hypothetical protein